MEHRISVYWRLLYLYGDISTPPPVSGLEWSLLLDPYITSSPVIRNNRLYIGSGVNLLAVNTEDHEVFWKFDTGSWVESSPAISGNTLFVGSSNGRLYAVDAVSGRKLWDINTDGKITSSPAVTDGVVFIGSHDGNLYAIN
jgi:outer membrane protein assembly factor BamB